MRRHLLALALLSGCATSVRVTHLAPPTRLGPDTQAQLSRVYVLVKGPKPVDSDSAAPAKILDFLNSFERDKDRDVSRPLDPAERGELGKAVARRFAQAGSYAAWQTVYDDALPPSVAQFGATAVLLLEPSALTATQESFSVKISSRQTGTRYRVSGSFGLRWKLVSKPGDIILAEGRLPRDFRFEQESGYAVGNLETVLAAQLRARQGQLLSMIGTEFLPHPVDRVRTVAKGKGTNKQAYERVRKEDWDGAAVLWRKRLEADSTDRTAHHDLAVYFERQKKWDDARQEYQLAGTLDAVAQLDAQASVSKPVVNISTIAFLQERLAVMPFGNESVDIEAPNYVRKKTAELLKEGGYNLQPVAETDAKLRAIGITDGGQIRAADEKALAAAAGVDRLVFGKVEEYKTVNVGVYVKRQVRVSLRLADAGGAELWTAKAQTIAQDAAAPKDAVESFLVNLATTQAKKIMKTYLTDEADLTVAKACESLPRYAGPSPNLSP